MNTQGHFAHLYATEVASLSREEVTSRLMSFPSRTHLDFTEDFLESHTLDALRHMLLSAMLHLSPP